MTSIPSLHLHSVNQGKSRQTIVPTAIQQEALDRARHNQTMSNYPDIFNGFMAKGISEADIVPRSNVFTYNAWKALGRQVIKGQHGVKVLTWIPIDDKKDEDGKVMPARQSSESLSQSN